MEEELIAYIRKEFLSDSSAELTAETKLISSGLIDSFSIVSLLVFIDHAFGKKVPAARVTAENFDSVQKIIEVINAC